MSANDYILITRDNRVIRCDAGTGPYNEGTQYQSLKEAVQAAQDIMDNELVEYGIHFERLNATLPATEQTGEEK